MSYTPEPTPEQEKRLAEAGRRFRLALRVEQARQWWRRQHDRLCGWAARAVWPHQRGE